MEYEGREESSNVEDRRGIGPRGLAIGGGGIGLVILIIGVLLGVIDPRALLGPGGPGQGIQQQAPTLDPKEEEQLAHFSKIILHDTEVIWGEQFEKMGKRYIKPTLVLYNGMTETACGTGEAAVGPFYCPGDSKVYLDLSFFREMQRKLNAPGEFARAYVIAHEVGHHVQRLLGYSKRVDDAGRGDKHLANQMSVRLELQADYFAGVWAHYGQEKYRFLDKGDLETALHAANQIGDDHLQKQARGYVVPDSFTHGSSEQRVRWFKAGFDTGDVPGAKKLFDLDYGKL
jgi:predicted metalloprotease